MTKSEDEERDIPFLHSDMNDHASTMDRPLDTTDAPGKADSEMGQDEGGLTSDAVLRNAK
jgi:hypothetical protein